MLALGEEGSVTSHMDVASAPQAAAPNGARAARLFCKPSGSPSILASSPPSKTSIWRSIRGMSSVCSAKWLGKMMTLRMILGLRAHEPTSRGQKKKKKKKKKRMNCLSSNMSKMVVNAAC